MSSLKALKIRINSVKSTQKMTKAMKMVAASKLRKAKTRCETSRDYSGKVNQLVANLSTQVRNSSGFGFDKNFELLTGRDKQKPTYLIILVTSDRGLCGGLNGFAVKHAKKQIEELTAKGCKVKLLNIGKKGGELTKTKFGDIIIENITGLYKNDVSYDDIYDIGNKIIELFNKGEFDICQLIYSNFISAIAQEPRITQIIPAVGDDKNAKFEASEPASAISYEPSANSVLAELLPKNIKIQLFQALLESYASEQGARMAAMESATTNAGNMIKDLTLLYNRTRQANITRELIDIVSGAQAV